MRYKEESLQTWCVKWFDMQYPQYRLLLHHSPNGGARTPYEGMTFKRMGTRAGFPDLVLLMPRGGYSFLCIEMKQGKGRQSESQKEYQRAVESVGAKYVVCHSFDEFKVIIDNYLEPTDETESRYNPRCLFGGYTMGKQQR